MIYPKDGLSLADSPLAYVDHGNSAKRQIFEKFQAYLLTSSVQKRIQALLALQAGLLVDVPGVGPVALAQSADQLFGLRS